MELLTTPIVELYRSLLQPVAPFTWLGLPLSTLDVAAALRLCVVMRQLREISAKDHATKHSQAKRAIKGKDKARAAGVYDDTDIDALAVLPVVENRSFVRDAAATLVVVYGGEVMSAPLLGIPPSFMLSGVVPIFYTLMQAAVEYFPSVPDMTLQTELPISLFDALSRAYLLCNLIPPAVTSHTLPAVATSPWTLLLTSLITANGGFLVVNALSFLSPGSLSLRTPPELQPYGWATADLWAAPCITALYALLTHAQPFWADLHVVLSSFLSPSSLTPVLAADGLTVIGRTVAPVDVETARAACALVLAALFSGRAARNFGAFHGAGEKAKEAMRACIEAPRLLGALVLMAWVMYRYGRGEDGAVSAGAWS